MNASLTVLVTLIMLMLPIGVILLLERVIGLLLLLLLRLRVRQQSCNFCLALVVTTLGVAQVVAAAFVHVRHACLQGSHRARCGPV